MIEYRYAEGKLDLLPSLASELVQQQVDVIVTVGTPGVLAAKNATGTIPIVFVSVSDPVANGVVASLARPGGNVTGLSILAPEFVYWLGRNPPNQRRAAILVFCASMSLQAAPAA